MVKGKKSAILVGCHYYGDQNRMFGSKNDVNIMQNLLINFFHIKVQDIKIMIEAESDDSLNQPTQENIKSALKKMIDDAGKGGILFFYFSGLGMLDPDNNNMPGIYSCDLHPLTASYFQLLVIPLRDPAKEQTSFTFVCESSCSSGLLNPVMSNDNTILISASGENEIAKRVVPTNDTAYGAFTHAVNMALTGNTLPMTNNALLNHVTESMNNYNLHPCLRCIERNGNATFLGYKMGGAE